MEIKKNLIETEKHSKLIVTLETATETEKQTVGQTI